MLADEHADWKICYEDEVDTTRVSYVPLAYSFISPTLMITDTAHNAGCCRACEVSVDPKSILREPL